MSSSRASLPVTGATQVGAERAHDGLAGAVSGYRERTSTLLLDMLFPIGRVPTAIDVGGGDGGFAKLLVDQGVAERCVPVDVARRASVVVEPLIYDGAVLPFDDRSVSLVCAIDAAHHADDPRRFVAELARVSARHVLVKDHTYATPLGRFALRVLDEIGNRRFAIDSPGRYQHAFGWLAWLRDAGFEVRTLVHPMRCHTGLLGLVTNGLQFAALLERVGGER